MYEIGTGLACKIQVSVWSAYASCNVTVETSPFDLDDGQFLQIWGHRYFELFVSQFYLLTHDGKSF